MNKVYLRDYITRYFSKLGIKMVPVWCIKIVIICLSLISPYLLKYIIDFGVDKGNYSILFKYVFLYCLCCLLSVIFTYCVETYLAKVKFEISNDYRNNILDNLINVNGKYISYSKRGELLHIMDGDLEEVSDIAAEVLFELPINVCEIIIIICILLSFEKVLVLPMVTLEILLIIINHFWMKKIEKCIAYVRTEIGELYDDWQELFGNLKYVILGNSNINFLKSIKNNQQKLICNQMELQKKMELQKGTCVFFDEFVVMACYLVGGILIIQKEMQLGDLMAVVRYIGMFSVPFMYIINFAIRLKNCKVAFAHVYKELEKLNNNIIKDKDKMEVKRIEEISFEDVYFSYNGIPVYNNVNIRLLKGNMYLFMGESGSGKSTFINLLYKLWSIDDGKILINGQAIEFLNHDSIRNRICVVGQEPLIFNKSLEDNLSVDGCDPNNRWIIDYLNLSDLFERQSMNILGHNGENISGGQKQRVAIARALLKDCDVFIFDESTSFLDEKMQTRVLNIIRKKLEKKIVVFIAHRQEVYKEFKNIYRFERGQVYYEQIQ